MIRSILTRIIRASEVSPSILAFLSITSVILGWVRDYYTPFLGEAFAFYFSVAAFTVSILLLFPIVVKDLNIWRLLPPEYDGIDRFLSYVSEDLGIRDCLFWGTDGRVRIDALRLLQNSEKLMSQISFVGADWQRQRLSAEINVSAFAGSRYGLSFENKLKRNSGISEKNPVSFALLDDRKTGSVLGLASTVPLSTASAAAYMSGQISDNDFNGEMIAVPGDQVGAIVFFLIAHDRRNRIVAADESLSAGVLERLINTCLLQAVLIALGTKDQHRFLVLAANNNPKLKQLFNRLKLKERSDLQSADQEAFFSNYIHFRDLEAARRHLKSEWPDLAELVMPGSERHSAPRQ